MNLSALGNLIMAWRVENSDPTALLNHFELACVTEMDAETLSSTCVSPATCVCTRSWAAARAS